MGKCPYLISHLIKWKAFMRKYLIFPKKWIWTMDQKKGKFYIRDPPLFILKRLNRVLHRIAAELYMHFGAHLHCNFLSFQLNFIQINMHTFLAQFSFTHSQLNLHTPFQINLHSHIDQSHFISNPSFLEGLVAFASNLRISNKAIPFRQKATGCLAG